MANRLKYAYDRAKLTVRISPELHALVKEKCIEIGVSLQDLVTYALIQNLKLEKNIKDYKNLSAILTNTQIREMLKALKEKTNDKENSKEIAKDIIRTEQKI